MDNMKVQTLAYHTPPPSPPQINNGINANALKDEYEELPAAVASGEEVRREGGLTTVVYEFNPFPDSLCPIVALPHCRTTSPSGNR